MTKAKKLAIKLAKLYTNDYSYIDNIRDFEHKISYLNSIEIRILNNLLGIKENLINIIIEFDNFSYLENKILSQIFRVKNSCYRIGNILDNFIHNFIIICIQSKNYS